MFIETFGDHSFILNLILYHVHVPSFFSTCRRLRNGLNIYRKFLVHRFSLSRHSTDKELKKVSKVISYAFQKNFTVVSCFSHSVTNYKY